MKDRNSNVTTTTKLIRLVYYNDFLFEVGAITSREHQKMNNIIISKYGNEANKRKDSLSCVECLNHKK